MKIGIITVHNVINYGAVFQAFALKEYLSQIPDRSDTVQVINYTPSFLEDKKKIVLSRDIRADLIELERLLLWKSLQRRRAAFDSFIRRNDNLSVLCKTKEELCEAVQDFDLLIAGSDQIWNLNITGGDRAYLLDFPAFTGMKMSYASSLGNYRFYKNAEEEIAGLLRQFSFLSCREKDGCQYIGTLTGMPCAHVCDPTLLLTAEAYAHLTENRIRDKIKKLAQAEYLLIYNLNNSNEIYDTAKKIADEKQLKVYQIFPSLRKNAAVDKLLTDISPEEFLYLYANARFIVTNSFHGTCFSIIHRKDFYTVRPTGSSNRISSMLDEIGLSERLLTAECTLPEERDDMTIRYAASEDAIGRFTSSSKSYLQSAILGSNRS